MASIRNVSGDDRNVPGLGGRLVLAGQIVDVPDADLPSYVCQPDVWADANPSGDQSDDHPSEED